MEKVFSLNRLIRLLDHHMPMENERAHSINMQFPVFEMLFNDIETDEEWLKSISMEQLEWAMDSLRYSATDEDISDDITIGDYRNPAFEYVHARGWVKDIKTLTPVRVKSKFF